MKYAKTEKFFSSNINVSKYYHETYSFAKKYNFSLPLYNIKNWQIHVLNRISKKQHFFCDIYCQEKTIIDIKKIRFIYQIKYIDYYSLSDFIEKNFVFYLLKSISNEIVLKVLSNRTYLVLNNKKYQLTPHIQKKYFGFIIINDKFTFFNNNLRIKQIDILNENEKITIVLSAKNEKYMAIDGISLIGVSYFFFKSLKQKFVAIYY